MIILHFLLLVAVGRVVSFPMPASDF